MLINSSHLDTVEATLLVGFTFLIAHSYLIRFRLISEDGLKGKS